MRTSQRAATGRRGVEQRCRAAVQIALLGALALLSACGATASQPRLAQLDPAAYTASGRLPTLEPSLTVLANAYLSRMSLDEKLGQLFVVEFVGPAYTPDNAAMVEELHAGGVLVYNREMPTFQAAHDLLAAPQAHAKIPLFTVVDEEGGWVDRMQDVLRLPSIRFHDRRHRLDRLRLCPGAASRARHALAGTEL
jgi:glycosyl hydrolase family 3